MADVTLTLDPVIGAAVTALTGGIVWFLKQVVKDRRARTAAIVEQSRLLIRIEVLLAGLGEITGFFAMFEERTRWMVRERRPSSLDEREHEEGAAPEEVEYEYTPVDGLREIRERTRTPPGGTPRVSGGKYSQGRGKTFRKSRPDDER